MIELTPQPIVESPSLLNPTLITALAIAFPSPRERLRVQHPGRRRTAPRGLLGLDGPPKEYGEEVHLDCPFCGDERGRMRVSHTYDPQHAPHRWHCFNEKCHGNPAFRQQLSAAVIRVWSAAKAQVRAGVLPDVLLDDRSHDDESGCGDTVARLPENSYPLTQLPFDHPARRYLESRGFDPDQLSARWWVGHSAVSLTPAPYFYDRLIIPFTRPGSPPVVVGWQARSLVDAADNGDGGVVHGDPPKYLTMAGMRKSQLLYTALAGIAPSNRLIVVEGATDAWSCGEDAVAILGNLASPRQIQLIVEAARDRQTIVVAFDSDAEREAQDLITRLQSIVSQRGLIVAVVRCPPPAGRKDFGECTDQEAQQALNAACLASPTDVRPRPRRVLQRDVPRTRNELAKRLLIHATGQSIVNPDGIEQQVTALGMLPLLTHLEEPLLPIIAEMERTRFRVDMARLNTIVTRDEHLRPLAEQLRPAIAADTGRVHTVLDPLGTRTGRITAKQYPLQSLKRELRHSIVADEGRSFICADFSQFDWRIAAIVSRDAKLLNAFANPQFDIYRLAAAAVLGCSEGNVSDSQRGVAKEQMMYFLFTLRSQPYHQEATALWCRLREELPEFMTWRESLVERSRHEGRVCTELGRIMALDATADSEKWASQALACTIQGNASDVFKQALLRLRTALPPDVRLLFPHHDSILFDAPFALLNDACQQIREVMEAPPAGWPMRFPVKVRCGQSWGECTSADDGLDSDRQEPTGGPAD